MRPPEPLYRPAPPPLYPARGAAAGHMKLPEPLYRPAPPFYLHRGAAAGPAPATEGSANTAGREYVAVPHVEQVLPDGAATATVITCPKCRRPPNALGQCWCCCDWLCRVCVRRWTGSAFISSCWQCQLEGAGA